MKIYQLILISTLALLMAGCGGTSRRSSSNAGYGYPSYGGNMFNGSYYGTYYPGTGYTFNNYGSVSNISSMVVSTLGINCPSTNCIGSNCRLPDFVTVGQAISNNSIQVVGSGAAIAGNISDIFVGRNSYGDLLIVTKMVGNGGYNNVVYNVIVSLCAGTDILTPIGSQITNFYTTANNYITLTVNANGAFGGATAQHTAIISTASGGAAFENSFVSILN